MSVIKDNDSPKRPANRYWQQSAASETASAIKYLFICFDKSSHDTAVFASLEEVLYNCIKANYGFDLSYYDVNVYNTIDESLVSLAEHLGQQCGSGDK